MTDNLSAFLDMIAACEGTGNAYNALFSYTPRNGRVFANDYLTHPNIKWPFTQMDGQPNFTTAAGRYQILHSTFARLSAKLGLTDFSPATQDAMAAELIAEDGAMSDVKNGNFQAAIDKCSGTWASLPASKYQQPKRSYDFALNAYTEAGGVVA
ncbi:MAG: glycoside hydrolase family 24 protein [Terriglobia bacterium]